MGFFQTMVVIICVVILVAQEIEVAEVITESVHHLRIVIDHALRAEVAKALDALRVNRVHMKLIERTEDIEKLFRYRN